MATSDSPTITLVFRGLFLFAFAEDNSFCQACVMEAERHCLKIKITTRAASLSNYPEVSFEVPDGDIIFEVLRKTSGVDTYEPGGFERDDAHDRRDFRWVLDFEGSELHDRKLPFKAGAVKRSVFINNGLFYTHKTQKVQLGRPPSASIQESDVCSSKLVSPTFTNVSTAQSVGCDIYLDNKGEFLFRYGPHGDYRIALKKSPDISYEVSVENLCPRGVMQPQLIRSDFAHYYELIDVPGDEQFIVLPAMTADDKNPCNPATVSLTKARVV